MKVCYFLIGLPASGKTTFLERRRATFKDFFVYSTDDELEKIAARAHKTYDDVWSPEIFAIAKDHCDTAMKWALKDRKNIVVDQTNMSMKARAEKLKLLKKEGYYCVAVIFPKPEISEWYRRLDSRPGKTIPEKVLATMQDKYQKPTLDEGFDEIFHAEWFETREVA